MGGRQIDDTGGAEGVAPPSDQTKPPDPPPLQTRVLRPRFTASGSEYFRIWLVNLLLVVATLGLYLPFAKARRLRYFYANTLVGGEPLAFHGDAWKMLRGHLVMLVLFGVYAASDHLSAWDALAAAVALAALWPALWRSALMFRLANTSWRGLRLGFDGSLAGAYLALLPVGLPALALVTAQTWGMDGLDPADPEAVGLGLGRSTPYAAAALLAGLLLSPWALARVRRYQHGGYRYAGRAARLTVDNFDFYALAVKTVALALAALPLAAIPFGLVEAAHLAPDGLSGGQTARKAAAPYVMLPVALVFWLTFQGMAAYFSSRLQNLCWNHTRAPQLQFNSALRAGALARLTLKNLALTALTLGLYRPFAVVQVHRLRLQAVTLQLPGDHTHWQAGTDVRPGSGSGEMSGDFFGIDLGL